MKLKKCILGFGNFLFPALEGFVSLFKSLFLRKRDAGFQALIEHKANQAAVIALLISSIFLIIFLTFNPLTTPFLATVIAATWGVNLLIKAFGFYVGFLKSIPPKAVNKNKLFFKALAFMFLGSASNGEAADYYETFFSETYFSDIQRRKFIFEVLVNKPEFVSWRDGTREIFFDNLREISLLIKLKTVDFFMKDPPEICKQIMKKLCQSTRFLEHAQCVRFVYILSLITTIAEKCPEEKCKRDFHEALEQLLNCEYLQGGVSYIFIELHEVSPTLINLENMKAILALVKGKEKQEALRIFVEVGLKCKEICMLKKNKLLETIFINKVLRDKEEFNSLKFVVSILDEFCSAEMKSFLKALENIIPKMTDEVVASELLKAIGYLEAHHILNLRTATRVFERYFEGIDAILKSILNTIAMNSKPSPFRVNPAKLEAKFVEFIKFDSENLKAAKLEAKFVEFIKFYSENLKAMSDLFKLLNVKKDYNRSRPLIPYIFQSSNSLVCVLAIMNYFVHLSNVKFEKIFYAVSRFSNCSKQILLELQKIKSQKEKRVDEKPQYMLDCLLNEKLLLTLDDFDDAVKKVEIQGMSVLWIVEWRYQKELEKQRKTISLPSTLISPEEFKKPSSLPLEEKTYSFEDVVRDPLFDKRLLGLVSEFFIGSPIKPKKTKTAEIVVEEKTTFPCK